MKEINQAEIDLILTKMMELFEKKRIEKKIKKTELAEKLGMTSQNVGDILAGKVKPSAERFFQLMQLLEVDNIFIEKDDNNKNIEFLEALINKKDELLETANLFDNLAKTIKMLFRGNDDIELNPENRIAQINIKATPEEKALIKDYAKEKGKSIVEVLLEAVKNNQK